MTLRNPARFMRGFRKVYAEAQRNPSTSGGLSYEARMVSGSGSDTRKTHKLSGPAIPFGLGFANGRVTERAKCNPEKCHRHKHDPEHA